MPNIDYQISINYHPNYMSSNSIKDTNESILEDSLTRRVLANLMLESVQPLSSRICLVVADYVSSERKILLSGLEITSISNASITLKISARTIYNWIAKGYITLHNLNGNSLVSVTEIRLVMSKRLSKSHPLKTSQEPLEEVLSTQSTPDINLD